MRLQLISVATAVALGLAGCASVKGEGYIKPGFDVSTIERIGIVDGNNPTYKADTRQALVDTLQMEFFKRGWNVVDRSNVQKAVDELDFQNSDLASPEDRKKLGHVLNVDALTIVNIASAGEEISITAKMLDTETGEVLWMGTGDGSVNSTSSMLAGAIVGAAVGAVAGHNMGDNADVGVIAGGIAGGAIGHGLTPSEMENAKAVVAKVCETLPVRM
jgi:hypothetical protein